MQLTLVDCPGHASLIKTIIGGAQIIDIMVLVIDVTKGRRCSPSAFSLRHIALRHTRVSDPADAGRSFPLPRAFA